MAGFDRKRIEELQGGRGPEPDEDYESGRAYFRTGSDGRIQRRQTRSRWSFNAKRMFSDD